MAMREIHIHIPVADNSGVSINEVYLKKVKDYILMNLAGGYTIQRVTGGWWTGGEVQEEEMLRFTIAVEGGTDDCRVSEINFHMETLATLVKREFKQDAVYFTLFNGNIKIR